MKIDDVLNNDLMIMDLQATTKEAVIDEMIQKLYENNVIDNIEDYKERIIAREDQTSTGLGDGIAMPHARHESIKQPAVLFGKSNKGVDF